MRFGVRSPSKFGTICPRPSPIPSHAIPINRLMPHIPVPLSCPRFSLLQYPFLTIVCFLLQFLFHLYLPRHCRSRPKTFIYILLSCKQEMWRCQHRQQILYQARVLLKSPSCKPPWLPFSFPYSDVPKKKGKLAPLQERKMVDRFRLWAKAGEGGNGCYSYRRSRTDRYGRPDGGNGGKGGDVILECSASIWDFSNLQHHLNAQKGGHGTSKNMIGSRGIDKVAQVPVGTVIHLVSGDVPSEESSSSKSLDPWEIPVGEGNQASSVPLINKQIGGSCSMVAEDFHDSSLPQNDDHNKSVHDIEKRSGCASLTEVETKDNTKSDESYNETSCLDVKCKETDGNGEVCSVNRTIGPEDEEEIEEEYKEEVVQYSVAELTQPGQRIVVARGGEGGLGNVASQKSQKSCRRVNYQISAPSPTNLDDTSAGKPGSESVIILELKSIADVGLVGMPNAGKSTLLGALSMAKPTVGNYAFTTLRPNIGNLNYEDFFSVKVADIPGLIKGAHANRGLGHAFLRHIERTKVLVYVVDLAAALDGKKGIPPWEQLRDLVMELEYHQEGMSNRPSLIVANKIDENGAEHALKEFERRVQGVPIFPVCAILQEGIPELKYGIRRLIDGGELHRVDLDSILVD